MGSPLDPAKVRSHLHQIHRYNLRQHSNSQRPSYAIGAEGGLLLCTWPDGGKPTLPTLARYDERCNPFDEHECGHWYGRALASWALLHCAYRRALSGGGTHSDSLTPAIKTYD